jgi:hypothetical protein
MGVVRRFFQGPPQLSLGDQMVTPVFSPVNILRQTLLVKEKIKWLMTEFKHDQVISHTLNG